MRDHNTWVCSVSVNNYRVCSGTYDGKLHIWSLETGAKTQVLEGHQGVIKAVVFNEDILYTSSEDKSFRTWDMIVCSM